MRQPKTDHTGPSPDVREAIARIPELDALRGLAAVGVLCLHTLYSYFFWAWSCVDLFFVLSGFLITSILLTNSGSPRMLLAFYVRRALRIWPVYYVALIATVFIYLIMGKLKEGAWPSVPEGHWLSLIFLQYTNHYFPNLPDLSYIWYFAHSWSLAVEEQFYLLWPLAFFIFQPRRKLIIAACAFGLLTTILARSTGAHFYLLITRLDGLLLGIALAFLAWGHNAWLYRIPARFFAYAAMIALMLLAPYMLSRGGINVWGDAPRRAVEVAAFSLFYAVVVAVAIRWSGSPLLRPLRMRPLLYLGRLSFAIYMYQVPLGYLGLEAVQYGLITKPVAHFLTWPATLLAAHASYILIERRILTLKQYFPYRPTAELGKAIRETA